MCFETGGCEMCCSHWAQTQKPSVTSSLMLVASLAFRQSALFTNIKYALDQSWLISLNHHHQLGVNRLKVTIRLSINPCDQNLTTVLLSAEFGCLMQLMRAGHVIYRESEQLDQCYYSFHSYFNFSQGFSHFVLFFGELDI